MPDHNPRNTRRAILAALVAVIVLGLAIIAGMHNRGSDKKDNRPLSPVASMEAEAKALKATPVVDCASIASKERLEQQLNTTLSQPNKLGGNAENGPKVVDEQFCNYSSKDGRILAQTSYSLLTTEGLKVYQASRTGKSPSITSKPLAAADLPVGIDDGYSFAPADMPVEMRSVYLNSGVALRVDHQVAIVSFRDFSKQLPAVRWDFTYIAAQALLDKK